MQISNRASRAHVVPVISGAVLCLAVMALLSGCSRKESSGIAAGRPTRASADPGSSAAQPDFEAMIPRVGGPASYVGSESCRECHEEQFASWHRSFHRTMTRVAAEDTVRARFHDVTLTNDGTRFVLSQKSNEFWVRMERIMPPDSGEEPPEPVEVRIGLVTGSHHMQVFWVPGGAGNSQIGFPFTWLIPEQRWVPRNSTFIRPPELAHRSEVWNAVCSRCHATGIEPRIDREARTMDTRAGELGIACEACHGPGERHVNARLADKKDGRTPDAQTLRGEIVQPKKLDPVRTSQVCGFCHSMKWFDQSENWLQNGFHFRPGDDLEQTTPIIRPSRVGSVPKLADYLARNPELLRDFFWPDGMIRVSGREYNGLLESPCYQGGKFSCLSCHSLHESDPDDQLARNRTGNAACTQCHERFRDESQLRAHTHHRNGSAGSECYNCHMPFTTYGVLKAIRSHQVGSPRISDQLSTGRPNACNLCHLDKTLDWSAGYLTRWYQHPSPGLTRDQSAVADSVRLALTGDAGQRALMAWHLGWDSALEVSGKAWVVPVLAQLLDDPYSAVRCVAERSLKQVDQRLVPAGYDFAVAVDSRSPVRDGVLENWRKLTASLPPDKQTMPASTLVQTEDPAQMNRRFEQLIRERDTKPVRLRE